MSASFEPTVPEPAGVVEGSQARRGRGEQSRSLRPGRARGKGTGRRGRLEVAILTGPALLVFVTFVILPVLLAAWFGFYKWRGYGMPTDFVGLANYRMILTDPRFQQALLNNGFVMVVSLLTQGVIALVMALLMNRKMRGRSLIRVLIFAPYVISEVIVGVGWRLILQPNGAFAQILGSFGLHGLAAADWLGDDRLARWTMMMILTWKYIGFAVILFLAGMQGIPEEIYEAAAVDGAKYWTMQTRITLPLLMPTVRIWGFLSIVGSMQLFDMVYIIWGPVAQFVGTSTAATYLVYEGRQANAYGYGSAVAVILFVVTFTLAMLYQRFVLRRDTQGALTGER
jgi:ABC-type sugar transport system permease subunit